MVATKTKASKVKARKVKPAKSLKSWEVTAANTTALLSRLTGYKLLTDNKSRALPYSWSGRKWKADAVWIAPEGCDLRGVCLEYQGVGKHSRYTGMVNDHQKGATAQAGGWLWFQTMHGSAEAMAPYLSLLIERCIDTLPVR